MAVYRHWLDGGHLPGHARVYGGRAPLADVCQELTQIGSKHSINLKQGKPVCNVSSLLAAPCTVVSIGSENNFEFERDIVRRSSCDVHVFDCTGNGRWAVPGELVSRVTLHFDCLGAPEWRYRNVPKGGRSHLLPKANHEYRSMDWPELLRSIGLSTPPALLKIDCEGCEVDVLHSLLASGHHTLLPDQLVVELHYPHEDKSYRDAEEDSMWQNRFNDLLNRSSAGAMAREMYTRAGFAIVGHVRGVLSCCQEVLFARTRCVRGGAIANPTGHFPAGGRMR